MIEQHDIYTLQSLPIEQVAEVLGYRVSRHKALCPFHNDTHASLTFNTRKNRYRCYVCDAHGDSINLVMKTLRVSFLEACSYLSNQFGLGITPTDNKYTQTRQVSSVKVKQQTKANIEDEKPDVVVNFAAESHVDRSIENPEVFLKTNGTTHPKQRSKTVPL